MAQPINQGWQQLTQGNFVAAEHIFEQYGGSREALDGLSRVALYQGDVRRAETLARESLSQKQTPSVQMLMGEILSAQGKRQQAENFLSQAARDMSTDAYARSLLGEQRVRQGRWDEGTRDFIDALGDDPERDAYRHTQTVITDLIDAYVAGRIPEKAAMKFVNRIDYSVPKSSPDMQTFFAEARRAINARQSLASGSHPPHAMLPQYIRQAAGRSRGSYSSQAAPGGTSSAGGAQPGQAPPARSSATQSSGPQSSAQQATPSRSPSRTSSPPPSSGASRAANGTGSANEAGIDANQKDLKEVIKRERSRNADLVAHLEQMGPPQWPSDAGYDSIDTVPRVSNERGSVLEGSPRIDTRDFYITSGDILTEIFLERCLRRLMTATEKDKGGNWVMQPESIAQMELNCRDGLLDQMPPVTRIFDDRAGFDKVQEVALATFVGECLVHTYDATWRFNSPPSETYLELGDARLEPFAVVSRWMDAEDKDDVHLEVLARQAEQASHKSTSLTLAYHYIDPTKELLEEALAAKLGELWSEYWVMLGDVPFAEIAATITPVSVEDAAIIFTIGEDWVPDFGRGPQSAAVRDDGTVGIVYLRDTGGFAPLASRKAVERYLDATFDSLDQEAARRAVEVLDRFHRPQWRVVDTDRLAQALSENTSQTFSSPSLRRGRSKTVLDIEGSSPQGRISWEISFEADALIRWRVEQ